MRTNNQHGRGIITSKFKASLDTGERNKNERSFLNDQVPFVYIFQRIRRSVADSEQPLVFDFSYGGDAFSGVNKEDQQQGDSLRKYR